MKLADTKLRAIADRTKDGDTPEYRLLHILSNELIQERAKSRKWKQKAWEQKAHKESWEADYKDLRKRLKKSLEPGTLAEDDYLGDTYGGE